MKPNTHVISNSLHFKKLLSLENTYGTAELWSATDQLDTFIAGHTAFVSFVEDIRKIYYFNSFWSKMNL